MCQAYRKKNNSVILLAKTRNKENNPDDINRFYSIDNPFSLKLSYLMHAPFYSIIISLTSFALYTLKNPRYFDLIHSRNRHTSFILTLFRVNHIYEIHNLSSNKIQLFFDSIIFKSKRNRIIAISNILKQDLIKFFKIDQSKIVVLHDGADIIDYTKVPAADIHGNLKFNIGYTGSFIEGKGVDIICKAAENLKDIGFHIIGGNMEDINKYKQKFAYSNLFFYGHKPHSELKSYLKSFNANILPNKKDVLVGKTENIGKYTSPLKLFEYMSVNKPIILSNLDTFREVITQDEGIFFKCDDINNLIKRIEYLIANYETITESLHLDIKLLNEYSWDVRVNCILSLLFDMGDKNDPGSS